jgi:hypothetical protein
VAIKTRAVMYVQRLENMPLTISDVEYRVAEMIQPEKWAYIVHDKDMNSEGTAVAPHLHLMMKFQNPRSIDSIAKKMSDKPQNFENMGKYGNSNTGFAYLIHDTSNSRNKYQYSVDDVKANFDFKKFITNLNAKRQINGQSSTKKQVDQIIDEMYAGLLTKNQARIKIGNMGGSVLASYDDKIERAYSAKLKIEAEKWQQEKVMKHEKKDIYWLCGETGTGKTSLAKKIATNVTENVFISGASNDPFQGYSQERAVVLDDLRPDIFEYSDLLRMLDPYSFEATTKARYKNAYLTADTIIITTPFNPKQFYQQYRMAKDDSFGQLARRISLVIRMSPISYWELALKGENYERTSEFFDNSFSRTFRQTEKLHLDDIFTPDEMVVTGVDIDNDELPF